MICQEVQTFSRNPRIVRVPPENLMFFQISMFSQSLNLKTKKKKVLYRMYLILKFPFQIFLKSLVPRK